MKQVIVWGPPCSGKSTYVREHAQEGDLVWDADAVHKALTGQTEHRHEKIALNILMGFREVFLRKTAVKESEHTAYCIVHRVTDRVRELAGDDMGTVFCDVTEAECLERLSKDESRPDKDAWAAIIRKWFVEYKRDCEEAEMSKTVDFAIIREIAPDDEAYNWQKGQYETVESDTSQRFFAEKLSGLTEKDKVNLYINSMGGSVKEALGIYNLLKRCPASVTAYIDGFAASAASVIAMAADKVVMPRNTCMMIHNAAWRAYGNPAQLRKSADDLEVINTSVINSYVMRAGDKLPEDKLTALMDSETWLTAADCVQYGLADEFGAQDADLSKAAEAFRAAASSGGAAYAKAPDFLAGVLLPAAEEKQKPQAGAPDYKMGSLLLAALKNMEV